MGDEIFMARGFVQSVLSTKKQRQAFFYFRNLIAFACALVTFKFVNGSLGLGLAVVTLILSYMTIAPVVAFVICLFEQMLS